MREFLGTLFVVGMCAVFGKLFLHDDCVLKRFKKSHKALAVTGGLVYWILVLGIVRFIVKWE